MPDLPLTRPLPRLDLSLPDGEEDRREPIEVPDALVLPAITPRGLPLRGEPPAAFDPVAVARLVLRTALTAGLATLDPQSGFPFATLTNLATDTDGTPVFLASRLALHTRNIEADPRVSLLLAPPGKGEAMTNARLTLVGRAERDDRPHPRARFLARHPKAALYADFPDFAVYRVVVAGVHLNGGFARAASLAPADLLLPQTDVPGPDAQALTAGFPAERIAEALRLKGRWRITGADPAGIDLRLGVRAARLTFPVPARDGHDFARALSAAFADAQNRP